MSLLSLATYYRDRIALRGLCTLLDFELTEGRFALFGTLLENASRSGLDRSLLDDLLGEHGRLQLRRALAASRELAAADAGSEEARVEALTLLGREPELLDHDLDLLAALLAPANPPTLAGAALAALDRIDDPRVGEVLMERSRRSPELLRALGAMLHREERTVQPSLP